MEEPQDLAAGGETTTRSCNSSPGGPVPAEPTRSPGSPGRPVSYRLFALKGSESLSHELRAAWQAALQDQHVRGGFASPFLGPTLAATMASVRPDVRLIVGFVGDEPRRFLPVHVSGRGRARPLGGRLCDVHGPVGALDPGGFREMLIGAGLRSWSFRRCPQRDVLSPSFVFEETTSHLIRTDQGVEGLRSGGLLGSTSQLKQALRKERKLAKEIGPLRFEYDHQDREILAQLLAWKADQRLRSGSYNILQEGWAADTVQSLHDVVDREDPAQLDGRGRMSVLWAGDHVVAAHFGLADERRMHWWIPTYAPLFAAHSPGLSLLLHLIRECHARGIEVLELGHGDERYKSGFATGSQALYSGAVDRSSVRLALGATGVRVRAAVRRSRLEPGWVATKRLLRRARALGKK
ncbi:hypothetical protein Poly30_06890 [Planctomycetes bacterium Poly30]|uniref:BioF2-like acetyltransferase domain-containing protein n=1 Tax=Saltatorellus ferox TaxID=2528018 RepID=A0A518EM92_9BACT|nr:hypothetical protein Poly30_06890 [Planctomycetes bacterium Poly30]